MELRERGFQRDSLFHNSVRQNICFLDQPSFWIEYSANNFGSIIKATAGSGSITVEGSPTVRDIASNAILVVVFI
jgi:hypothetical protein